MEEKQGKAENIVVIVNCQRTSLRLKCSYVWVAGQPH